VIEIDYSYVAYNENKELVKGKLEAKNEDHASQLLSYAGYQIINLKELAAFPTLDKLFLRFTPVKSNDVILFYRQLALLIDSGLNIVTSLELLQEQNTNRIFKKMVTDVIADIRSGSQLSAALSKHPHIFPPIHCQSLKVGEQTGGLEAILRQMADHMEKQANSGKSIKNAMTYPVIASIVAIVVMAVMVMFVLPTFNSLYSSLGVKVPFLTQLMLDFGKTLRGFGIYLLAVIGVFAVAVVAYLKTASGRYKWDQLSLRFPVIGRINHLSELAQVSRSISVLFKSGITLTEILPTVIQCTNNKVVSKALVTVRDEMLGGEGLSRPMSRHPVFLPMMVQMVRVGEETGSLDSTLLSVAQSYESEAEDKTKTMIGLIQPVMTIVIGLVVGVMALSMVTAMYSLYNQG
jgi:type IV pilus assembly protein PilC